MWLGLHIVREVWHAIAEKNEVGREKSSSLNLPISRFLP